MDNAHLAEKYGKALYDLAFEAGRIGIVREQLAGLLAVITAMPSAEQFFTSPLVTSADRQRVLDKLADDFDSLVNGLLSAMNRRNRLGLIRETIMAFADEDNRRHNRGYVTVTTAAHIDDATRKDIERALSHHLDYKPIVRHRIDPDILGGFVARAGDRLIDASLSTQLAGVRARLLAGDKDEV